MTDEQVKMFCDAINNLAEAIREVGTRIAEDEPLNYSIGAGLYHIKEAILGHSGEVENNELQGETAGKKVGRVK